MGNCSEAMKDKLIYRNSVADAELENYAKSSFGILPTETIQNQIFTYQKDCHVLTTMRAINKRLKAVSESAVRSGNTFNSFSLFAMSIFKQTKKCKMVALERPKFGQKCLFLNIFGVIVTMSFLRIFLRVFLGMFLSLFLRMFLRMFLHMFLRLFV